MFLLLTLLRIMVVMILAVGFIVLAVFVSVVFGGVSREVCGFAGGFTIADVSYP